MVQLGYSGTWLLVVKLLLKTLPLDVGVIPRHCVIRSHTYHDYQP